MESCRRTYVANNGNQSGDRAYPEFLALDLFPGAQDYPAGQQGEAIECLDKMIPMHKNRFPNVPLLFAICAPCQPFTRLSKGKLSETRVNSRLRDRSLLAEACKFVKRYQPDMILSENVAGITDARYGGVWEDFKNSLRELGFRVASRQICTSDFGIAQYRKRSILCAIRSEPERVLEPLLLPGKDRSAPRRTVADVFEGLPPLDAGQKHREVINHVTRNLSALNRRRISYAEPGKSNEYLSSTPEGDLSLACHKRVNERLQTRCFTDVYTRMAPNRPSPTITTRCHSITNGRFGHPDMRQLRGISMREAARLQSFRDEYVFYPVDQVQPIARMIGNAVPPVLAQFFADHLVNMHHAKQ